MKIATLRNGSFSLCPPLIRDQCLAVTSLSYPLNTEKLPYPYFTRIYVFPNSILSETLELNADTSLFSQFPFHGCSNTSSRTAAALLDSALCLKACGHYYLDTDPLLHLRRADITQADCTCDCAIIGATSGQR